MKKHLLRLCALILALALCGCAGNAAPAASSEGKTASSKTSSRSKADPNAVVTDPATGYVDVDATVIARGQTRNNIISNCFVADAKGYLVNEGPYLLDADTLTRLTDPSVTVTGTGSVKWAGWEKASNYDTNPDTFDGVIPVTKLHDPIFCSTALPSEGKTSMASRVNASNMHPNESYFANLCGIGAVYRSQDVAPVADDAPVTIGLSDMYLLICTGKSGWFVAQGQPYPNSPMIYNLPWTKKLPTGSTSSMTDKFNDHIEIKLTGAAFSAAKYRQLGATEAVLHFWSSRYDFKNPPAGSPTVDPLDIKGVFVCFKAWVKEPENSGKFIATIGADWRDEGDTELADQCFSGRNYVLTNEPRWIIGHNVGPKAYDSVMDVEKVLALTGIGK